jgi:hypothetical protein
MLVCDEHKFVFLRNPKTASRSLTRALSEIFNVRQVGLYHNWEIPEDLAGYFVFIVVRNPYVRAVSGWQHWASKKNISFDEWTQEIIQPIKGNVFPKGRHWRRQTEILDEIGQDVFLIRYDNLEEELNSLSFIDNIVLPFIGVQDYGDWRTHYTPEIEARIYQTCKEDFERLGYERWHFDKRQIGLL